MERCPMRCRLDCLPRRSIRTLGHQRCEKDRHLICRVPATHLRVRQENGRHHERASQSQGKLSSQGSMPIWRHWRCWHRNWNRHWAWHWNWHGSRERQYIKNTYLAYKSITNNSAILFQQGGEQMDGVGSSTHFRMEDRLNVTRIMGTRVALSGAIAE